MIKKARKRRIPDNKYNEMDFFVINGIKANSRLRFPYGDSYFPFSIHTGMGKSDIVPEPCGFQSFSINNPGQNELFIFDKLLLD